MDLKNIKTFYLLSKHKSFKAVGESISLPQSSISRRIQSLEKELGVILFNRSTSGSGITLTDEGRIFLEHANVIISEIDRAEKRIKDKKEEIRILASPNMAGDFIVPCLTPLHNFPIIDISTKEDGFPFDAYIGSKKMADQNLELCARHPISFSFYASPEYMSCYQKPYHFKSLEGHTFIIYKAGLEEMYSQTNTNALLDEFNFNGNVLYADSGFTELRMVENGLGIGLLADVYQNISTKKIELVTFQNFESMKLNVYFYIDRGRVSLKNRDNLILLFERVKDRLDTLSKKGAS